MTILLETISNKHRYRNGGKLSDMVTDAFNELLREPLREHSPHEFEEVDATGIDGRRRKIRIFPRRWIARLEKAIEVGAFGRMSASEVAQKILATDQGEPL